MTGTMSDSMLATWTCIDEVEGGFTFDYKVRAQNTHGRNADAGLGCAIGGSKAGEDDSGRAAHGAEEGL